MQHPKWISAQDLDERWAATPQAKVLLPELLRRLVFATVSREHLQKVDFPSDAETQRPGYDGTTVTSQTTPFVPDGVTFWELGTTERAEKKANDDYLKRVKAHRGAVRAGQTDNIANATYIAVTARDWQNADTWARRRSRRTPYKAVRAYDSNALEQWIYDAPAVGLWLAQKIHGARQGVSDLEQHWGNIQGTLRKPIPSGLLLVTRDAISKFFDEWLGNPTGGQLLVKAPSAAELVAVFCAWVFSLPEDRRDAVSSRAIIVDDRETWRSLATSQQPLILIPSPRLNAEPEVYAEAIRGGHHVLRFAEFRTPAALAPRELPQMRRFELQEALKKAGFADGEARQLAESAGGNFTILRRRLASTTAEPPGWANDGALAPLLLCAAWEDEREEDQRIISTIAGVTYADVQALMKRWRPAVDAPVRLVPDDRGVRVWEFLSPLDAWEPLHAFLDSAQMDRFEAAAVEVLSEDEPAYELPPEERIMASVKAEAPRFSRTLRRGFAEMLALGATREDESCIGSELRFAQRAQSIVRRLLPDGCSWKRWASLGQLLPLLVEAAPEVVLRAIERDLKADNSQLVELMRQEIPGGVFGAAYHSGALWALETAAWPREHLQRVSLILARLAERDPGGTWGNRPAASLSRVFFSWRPQTMAAVAERVAALKNLATKQAMVTWQLVLGLLPQSHEVAFDSAKPSYREWAAGWTGEVTVEEYNHFVSEVTNLALNMAEADPTRLPELLSRAIHLRAADLAKVVSALERLEQGGSQEHRAVLWEKLRKLVEDHTNFREAWWALPAGEVARLAELRDRLQPAEPVTVSKYLFDDDGLIDGDETVTYDQKRERRQRERRAAIGTVWSTGGLAAVVSLAKQVSQPWAVGWTLGEELRDIAQPDIIPAMLGTEDDPTRKFASAFMQKRVADEGREWAEALPEEDWSADQRAELGLAMPVDPRTWDWLETQGSDADRRYWELVGVWGATQLPLPDVERAVKKLTTARRAWSALDLWASRIHAKLETPTDALCDALDAVVDAPSERNAGVMDAYHVQQVFGLLQKDPTVDVSRVARLEFAFLPILDRHSRLPLTLQKQLAKDPEFFIDCLRTLYKGHSEVEAAESDNLPEGTEAGDPGRALRAQQVWRLLHDWIVIPGSDDNGLVSLNTLRLWVSDARRLAKDADRLTVCDITIGELFARSSEDNDGAKPLTAIREIIEECESDDIEHGLILGLRNLRGTYSKALYEGGDQERALAATFQRYAQLCQKWPRTSAALRAVADDYIRDGKRADERAAARQ